MEKIVHMKDAVVAALAVGLGGLAKIFGGWDAALGVLIGFMAADYLTGLVVAGIFKRSPKSGTGALESRAGLKGLFRKGGILLLVLVGVWLDNLLGAVYIRPTMCLFFIANEGLSVLENLGLMGVPLPGFLRNMLEAMRDKADSGEQSTR